MTDAADGRLRGLTVMIAEDSWHLATSVRLTIEQAGGRIAGVASSLAKAEALAAAGGFDAAVMDLDLRGASAEALAMRMAKAGVKVVILTGGTLPPQIASVDCDCLTKPVEADALIEALARPLRQAREG
jgi:DNA-binding NtrC family response regulator